jgi:hypothetical protein
MHTQKFNGLNAGQVSELIDIFGTKCHDWDKAQGRAEVDFDSFDEAQDFVSNHTFVEA